MTGNAMVLTMYAPGASPDDIRAGVAAAERIFAANGTTAEEVALAAHHREWDDVCGAFVLDDHVGPKPQMVTTRREMQIADLWFEAGAAALAACYGTRPKPETAQLILRPTSIKGAVRISPPI